MVVLPLGLHHQQRTLPAPMQPERMPPLLRVDVPDIYPMGCDTWYTDAALRPCVVGATDNPRTVVLLGDSIGAQWFSMVPSIFREPIWRTVVLTKSSCPMVDEAFYYERIGRIYEVCRQWRDAALAHIEALRPELVIMGSASTYPFSPEEWREGSARVLARLGGAAGAVMVIPGTPALRFHGPGCAMRNRTEDGGVSPNACTTDVAGSRVHAVAAHLEHTASLFPNVHVLNLNDLVCPGAVCNAVTPEGRLVFRDTQHLTDHFVRSRVPKVAERIQRLLEEL